MPVVDLTEKEHHILQELANGKTITAIALDMNYSRDWISDIAAKLYKKLGARNAPNAVAMALREGLID